MNERESERREIDSERRGSSSSEVAFFVRALKRNGEYFHAVFRFREIKKTRDLAFLKIAFDRGFRSARACFA